MYVHYKHHLFCYVHLLALIESETELFVHWSSAKSLSINGCELAAAVWEVDSIYLSLSLVVVLAHFHPPALGCLRHANTISCCLVVWQMSCFVAGAPSRALLLSPLSSSWWLHPFSPCQRWIRNFRFHIFAAPAEKSHMLAFPKEFIAPNHHLRRKLPFLFHKANVDAESVSNGTLFMCYKTKRRW